MIQYKKMLFSVAVIMLGIAAITIFWVIIIGNRLVAPTRQTVPTPPQRLHLETVEFMSINGTPLRGWYGHSAHTRVCLLLLHGVRSHRGEMLGRAEFLMKHGYSVLLFDFQAHGESLGDAITFGYREAENIEAAVAFVRKRTPETKLGAIGFSLGGAAVLLSSVVHEFDALILEAVYPTIKQAIANRLRMRFGVPGVWLTPLLTRQLQWRLHVDPDQLTPVLAMPRVRCPLLIIGGTEDQRTRQEDTASLFDAASGKKELWLIPGATHENFHLAVPKAYEQRILTFLANAFSP